MEKIGLLIATLVLAVVKANVEIDLMKAIVGGQPRMAPYVRPVADASKALSVGNLFFAPTRIVDYVEKGVNTGYGTLTLAGWITMSWRDVNLGWNPEDYGGISKLTIPAEIVKSSFWVPDITPYDGSPWAERVQEVDALARSDGVLYLVPPAHVKFECTPDHGGNATACSATFGSWTHDGYSLDIGRFIYLDTSVMGVHPEWEVLSAEANREVKTYPCCKEPYVSVKFTITLQSKYGPFSHVHHHGPPM